LGQQGPQLLFRRQGQGGASGTVQQHLPAAATRDPRHRSGSGANRQPTILLQPGPNHLHQGRGGGGRRGGRNPSQPQQTSPGERDLTPRPPQGQFLGEKPLVTAIDQVADDGMIGVVGLHQHLARAFAPARPTRQLQQQLEALFGSPQVRSVQETIGGQHDRQGHLGQIHPLGEHLGAHQDISLAGGEAFEQAAMAIPSPGGVMVKTQQPQVREFAVSKIYLEGELKYEEYTDKKGEIKKITKIICEKIDIIEAKNNQHQEAKQNGYQPDTRGLVKPVIEDQEIIDDEIPF